MRNLLVKKQIYIDMKPLSQKLRKTGLSLLWGTTVWLFWRIVYPGHLQYHEQYQLFLFDMEYWKERIAIPGGMADYISEFLVQFYYHTWMGATMLALLFIGLQLLTWKLAKRQGTPEVYYPLSFLPAIAVWHFMCDENAMLSFVVALLMTLVANYFYTFLHTKWKRAMYVLVCFPVLLWMAGATHLIFMGWIIISELHTCFKKKEIPPRNRNRGRDVRIESHLHAIDKHASAEPHLPAKRISRLLPFPCGDSPDGNDNHPSVHRAPLSAGPAPPDAQACISIYSLTEHGISSNKLSLYSFKLQF